MKTYLIYSVLDLKNWKAKLEVISKDQLDRHHKVRAKVIDTTPDRSLQVLKTSCDRDAISIK